MLVLLVGGIVLLQGKTLVQGAATPSDSFSEEPASDDGPPDSGPPPLAGVNLVHPTSGWRSFRSGGATMDRATLGGFQLETTDERECGVDDDGVHVLRVAPPAHARERAGGRAAPLSGVNLLQPAGGWRSFPIVNL